MSKSVYIVRCTATATIGEAWRVTATDETSAINAVLDGNGEAIELLRDWTIGDEEGRANFEAVLESDETAAGPLPTADMVEVLAACDEHCQAGLNSATPEHWQAALQDILDLIRPIIASTQPKA